MHMGSWIHSHQIYLHLYFGTNYENFLAEVFNISGFTKNLDRFSIYASFVNASDMKLVNKGKR